MGTVDDILINYANFVGDELRAFHLKAAQLMTRLNAIEDDMAQVMMPSLNWMIPSFF